MITTRHPLLILTSGLIALTGLAFVGAAVAGRLWILPKFKEILTDFGPTSDPLLNNIDTLSTVLNALTIIFAAVGTALSTAAVGIFFRNCTSWRIALVAMWIMMLLAAFSVFAALWSGDLRAILSAVLAAIPAAAILSLLYLRPVRPLDVSIERVGGKTALA